jgi:hypothetical protein
MDTTGPYPAGSPSRVNESYIAQVPQHIDTAENRTTCILSRSNSRVPLLSIVPSHMNLTDLPVEILEHIVHQIDDAKDLLKVALTNKRFSFNLICSSA